MQNQSGAGSSKGPGSEAGQAENVQPGDGLPIELSGTRKSPEAPLNLRFALVGPGRVGATLGRCLIESGGILKRISGLRDDSPRLQGLVEAARGAGGEAVWCPSSELSTEDLDLLLITVSDPALRQVAELLSRRPQAPVALHVAGQFDAEILAPLRSVGCRVGSMHPLKAFADSARASGSELESLHGVWFGIDGDPEARDSAQRLVASWAAYSVIVTGDQRAVYHLAATLAAGGVATLLSVVEELLGVANLPTELLQANLALTRGALAAVEQAAAEKDVSVASKITGPAARGDLVTLGRQKEILAATAPHLLPLVERLQHETLRRCGWVPPEGAAGEGVEGDTTKAGVEDRGPTKIPPPAERKTE